MSVDQLSFPMLHAEQSMQTLFACTRLVGSNPHPCRKPGVSSAEGPGGARLILCRDCDRIARRLVRSERFADWRVEPVAQP